MDKYIDEIIHSDMEINQEDSKVYLQTAEDVIHKTNNKNVRDEIFENVKPKEGPKTNKKYDSISSISDENDNENDKKNHILNTEENNYKIKKIRKRPVITKNIQSENMQVIRRLDGSFNYK